jgi:hypothetical protein
LARSGGGAVWLSRENDSAKMASAVHRARGENGVGCSRVLRPKWRPLFAAILVKIPSAVRRNRQKNAILEAKMLFLQRF